MGDSKYAPNISGRTCWTYRGSELPYGETAECAEEAGEGDESHGGDEGEAKVHQ